MPMPEERPAALPTTQSRMPLLFVAGLGMVFAAAIWLASEQTRQRPAPELASAPLAPPAAPIQAPPDEATPAEAAKLAPEGAEADSGAAVPDRYEMAVRIERNDTFARILEDLGIDPGERERAEAAFRRIHKNARLPQGETVTALLTAPADPLSPPLLLQLALRPKVDREILLLRRDDGSYEAQEKIYQIVARLARASGRFAGGLRASAEAAGVPPQVMTELARAFSYDIDFQRDIRNGDRFQVLIEQAVTTDGRVANPGRLLWAEITLKRGPVAVWRFRPERGPEQFYTGRGESVVRSFLRTPMDLSRVSSRFGLREHPILGFTAMHTGVDFAAPYGTPILAAGGGKVEMAAANGGYGNYVRIRHSRDVATAYAHLVRFAPGIKPGANVRQGQVIGFVGSTGMSTGPHLHYEFHAKGKPVNPLAQKVSLRNQLAGKDLARFNARVAELARGRNIAHVLAPPDAPAQSPVVAANEPAATPKPVPAAATDPRPISAAKPAAAPSRSGPSGPPQAVRPQ